MNKADIIRYWHAVELLQPQTPPPIEKRNSAHDKFTHDVSITENPVLPWSADSLCASQPLPKTEWKGKPKRKIEWHWRHTLYAHLYQHQHVADALDARFGASQGYRESDDSLSALFAISFSHQGHLLTDSFVLSSEAWFLGRVLNNRDWREGFDSDQQTLKNLATSMLGAPFSGETLRDLTCQIRAFLGLDDFFDSIDILENFCFRFLSVPIQTDAPEKPEDPLNSFFLNDLNLVLNELQAGRSSPPLEQYLSRHDSGHRQHIDDPRNAISLLDKLLPERYADACWPAKGHYGLVHAQQFAVNVIHQELQDADGILGINGPPGTGKTTLLRDLIASVICQRADRLAALHRASKAFREGNAQEKIVAQREDANDTGKRRSIYLLDPALFGFEMIVASSNNGAVENITRELPQLDAIDPSWQEEARHFSEIGSLLLNDGAWGLISAPLGSKSNRSRFVSGYFYGDSHHDAHSKAPPSRHSAAGGTGAMPNGGVTSRDDTGLNTSFRCPQPQTPLSSHPSSPPEQASDHPGFEAWLEKKAKANINRTAAEKERIWQQAVAQYEAAKKRSENLRADASRIRQLLDALRNSQHAQAANDARLQQLRQALQECSAKIHGIDQRELQPASDRLKACNQALSDHERLRPGLMANLLTLWGRQRRWAREHVPLDTSYRLARSAFDQISRQIEQLQADKAQTSTGIAALTRHQETLASRSGKLRNELLTLAREHHATCIEKWLECGAAAAEPDIERAEPWQPPDWRKARAEVFIQALRLHQTFLELEASRMRANLSFVNSILQGNTGYGGVSRDGIRSAWASLFMVVPVLSSTFASFDRSFRSLKAAEIGWLLIDEAGQATPQAAVGALWRARRAVVVGDPLQLKPILKVSDAVMEHMRTHYQLDPHWLPNRQSAQTLADAATRWGRMAGPEGEKTWVGLPLVVHRRCDRPMFELANRIAYDNAMVYGTSAPAPGKETPARLPTGWIDVRGASSGNWVPAETEALDTLLRMLADDGVDNADIAVITPFKDVNNKLKELTKGRRIKTGTIHTMQGKEAAVVIFVLGGNTQGDGARNWAVSEPNLLNVAATRAKRRFYVIGDRSDWQNRNLFRDVMDLLPALTLENLTPPLYDTGRPLPSAAASNL
ncbi:MAG: AAA domain-containing protein [Lautropia sp.]|nr:AAA domain-containing protein [Lautropia sp.]